MAASIAVLAKSNPQYLHLFAAGSLDPTIRRWEGTYALHFEKYASSTHKFCGRGVLKSALIDLGFVAAGSSVPVEAVLSNHASSPIEIGWLNMGPNLRLEEYSRSEIEPGAEGAIRFVLTIPEESQVGRIERAVTIHSKSGGTAESFRIVASIDSNQ